MTIETSIENGYQLGLPKSFVTAIYELIHDESIRRQSITLQAEITSDIVKKL